MGRSAHLSKPSCGRGSRDAHAISAKSATPSAGAIRQVHPAAATSVRRRAAGAGKPSTSALARPVASPATVSPRSAQGPLRPPSSGRRLAGEARARQHRVDMPIPAGNSDTSVATANAGTITSAVETGAARPSEAETAATASTRAAIEPASQPRMRRAPLGDRPSEPNTSSRCESLRARGALCRAQTQAATAVHAVAPSTSAVHAGSAPLPAAARTSTASSAARAGPTAAGMPLVTQSRPSPGRARANKRIRHAPPALPGSSEFTSDPIP